MDRSPLTADEREHALSKVQRRVAAIGFFAVAIHGVLGTIGLALVIDRQGRHGDALVLAFMSGAIALITYVVVRLILQREVKSPGWIALSLTPTAATFATLA